MNGELIVFVVAQFSFIVGFLLGRLSRHETTSAEPENKSLFNKVHKTPAKMAMMKIDDTRFVTKVNDAGFVKTGKDLGKSSSVEDDIGSSVSRLAQLKKNK